MFKQLNLGISILVFAFSVFVVGKALTNQESMFEGNISFFKCEKDERHKNTYVYQVSLEDNRVFSNRLETPCSIVREPMEHEDVTLHVKGKQLLNIYYGDESAFDSKEVATRSNFILSIFVVIMLISIIDIILKLRKNLIKRN